MKQLSYQTLRETGYDGYLLEHAPERVLQFGEGNFMRSFVDYFIDVMNEKADFSSKVVLVQPRGGSDMDETINAQEGLYTLYLRGFENGEKVNQKRVISCISRCLNPRKNYGEILACADNPELRFITCNTTDSGIVFDEACRFADMPPAAYPAKLTQLLYRRFLGFGGQPGKGFIILACELTDDNGKVLQNYVERYARLWKLDKEFIRWIREENRFCSTLVDRIATGYPKTEADRLNAENGYTDALIDTAEIFAAWVIEGPQSLAAELPFAKAGLPVIFTDDHKPYKKRKVRILNGAHTATVLGAYLAGFDIVRDCMHDGVVSGFLNKAVSGEIIPTIDLPKDELYAFACAVSERFQNPFIDHQLLSISLNSTAKWKARILPSFLDFVKMTGRLPQCLTASFAFYLAFYRGIRLEEQGLIGRRKGNEYVIQDDRAVLEFFFSHKDDDAASLTHAVMSNAAFWGQDLTKVPGFEAAVARILAEIETRGTYEVMRDLL